MENENMDNFVEENLEVCKQEKLRLDAAEYKNKNEHPTFNVLGQQVIYMNGPQQSNGSIRKNSFSQRDEAFENHNNQAYSDHMNKQDKNAANISLTSETIKEKAQDHVSVPILLKT